MRAQSKNAQTIANPPAGCRVKKFYADAVFLLCRPSPRMRLDILCRPKRAGAAGLPSSPHPPQLLRGPESGPRGNPFQVELALRNQLLGKGEADQLHIVEGRA